MLICGLLIAIAMTILFIIVIVADHRGNVPEYILRRICYVALTLYVVLILYLRAAIILAIVH